MIRTVCASVAFVLVAWAVAGRAEDPDVERWRNAPHQKQARAYRELFEKVGRAGLPELAKDKDSSLALHAEWELRKKFVEKRKGEAFGTYDAEELKKFLRALAERTKVAPPEWWEAGLLNLEVEIGRFHVWRNPKHAKRISHKLGPDTLVVWNTREGVQLALRDKSLAFKPDAVSLEVPKEPFRMLLGDLIDLTIGKRTALAGLSDSSGYSFDLFVFENTSSKLLWTEKVWARGLRVGGNGTHRAELMEKGGSLFVFGADSFSFYAEGFDLETGKVRFRFCSNYWCNPSEKWELM